MKIIRDKSIKTVKKQKYTKLNNYQTRKNKTAKKGQNRLKTKKPKTTKKQKIQKNTVGQNFFGCHVVVFVFFYVERFYKMSLVKIYSKECSSLIKQYFSRKIGKKCQNFFPKIAKFILIFSHHYNITYWLILNCISSHLNLHFLQNQCPSTIFILRHTGFVEKKFFQSCRRVLSTDARQLSSPEKR